MPIDLSQYILLEETDKHPDLIVPIERTLFNLNHPQTQKELERQNSFMLSFEFSEFLRRLSTLSI